MVAAGFAVYDSDPRVLLWADQALAEANTLDLRPDRCGETWHVGVDALPNDANGAIGGVPLHGPWDLDLRDLHRAQLSVIYPEYPRQDAGESDAAHRFRINRCAAHMDGLLPEGADKRRHLREPHAYILGVPLGEVVQSPLVVWSGSHEVMGEAFADIFAGMPPEEWGDVDVTDAYQAARRVVFAQCVPEPLVLIHGQSVVLHRHLIHGVAPWDGAGRAPRLMAYFRPQFQKVGDWL